jgi:hypothetical protein
VVLVAIDPGKVTGVATFEDGVLVHATVCTPEECRNLIKTKVSGVCVIEVPQVYPGQQQKGDQNDLINLAVDVGRYAERAEAGRFRVILVRPREWKGQLPKDVCWKRVRETLTLLERANMAKVPKSQAHNMHDAIGIGTWFQKRRR